MLKNMGRATRHLDKVILVLLLLCLGLLFGGGKYCPEFPNFCLCRLYSCIAPHKHGEISKGSKDGAQHADGDSDSRHGSAAGGTQHGSRDASAQNGERDDSPGEAVFQYLMVVGISGLWFLVFRKSRKIKGTAAAGNGAKPEVSSSRVARGFMIFGSIAVALFWAIAMRSAYTPAVFVMALVGIFVAAEHYGALEQANGTLGQVNSTASQQTEVLASANKLLDEQRNRIEQLLNTHGLEKFTEIVYQAYRKAAQRIDAVIRVFNIDPEWWECNESGPVDNAKRWEQYKAAAYKPPHTRLTLYQALTETRNEHHPTLRTDKVQFVCEMPPPTAFLPDEFERLVPREKAERFEEILGFTWWLIVMQNVRRERETKWRARFGEDGGDNSENFPYVRIVNAHCPFWMHVIDEDVFQMIRGRRWIQSSGSKLTITPDPENRQISEWARQNIQQHARRGREAESYLCALFFYAATREGLSVETPLSLAFPRVLLTLGLDQYVELKAPRPEGLNISFDHIRKTCEGLFETFFVEMQRRCGHSSDSNLRLTFQLRHLLMELS